MLIDDDMMSNRFNVILMFFVLSVMNRCYEIQV